MISLPQGFVFDPTDEELISNYLLRWVTCLTLNESGAVHQHILEKNLYGDEADPGQVFDGVADCHWEITEDEKDSKKEKRRVIYVVTKLSKIGKIRITRRAGRGTWSGQTPPSKICDEAREWIGMKRMLAFEGPKDEEEYHWIMHEFSLDGQNSMSKNWEIKHPDYVICRITRVTRCLDEESTVNQTSTSCKKRSSEIAGASSSYNRKQQKRELLQQPVDNQFFAGLLRMTQEESGQPSTSSMQISVNDQSFEGLMMSSGLPPSSPDSIGLTQEELSFLDVVKKS